MALHRQWPWHMRPLPSLIGFPATILGLWLGLNWNWDWALQTGNIFLLIRMPGALVDLGSPRALWFVLAIAGLATLVVFARVPRRALKGTAHASRFLLGAPRFRFYPWVLALGLFLAYFGTVFLFKASVAADIAGEGLVLFVYLNYAGIIGRGIISIIGLAVLGTGLWLVLGLTFQFGTGREAKILPRGLVAPEPAPAPAAAPTPTVTASPRSPTPGPSTGPPSSASPRARSPSPRAPPARTGAAPTRSSRASPRATAETARP